jgi:hypothetical protein
LFDGRIAQCWWTSATKKVCALPVSSRAAFFVILSRRVVIFDEENLATNEVIKEEVRRYSLVISVHFKIFDSILMPCPLYLVLSLYQEYGREDQ